MKKISAIFTLFLVTQFSFAQTKFVNIVSKDTIPESLEVATVRYEKDGIIVDLISAIHIGDTTYYQQLNKQFVQYDSLLYELVGPKGATPKKKEGIDVYKIVGLFLDLDSQVDCVDYKAKNFVHADLSFEEMGQAIKDKGHDGYTIAFAFLSDVIRQNNLQKGKPQPDYAKFEHEDQAVYLKRVMAHSMANDKPIGIMHTLLIEDRNEAAFKVLEQELKKGKKKLGLFYGAAHMPDFEERLLKIGFKKKEVNWSVAWDIKPKKSFLDLLLGN